MLSKLAFSNIKNNKGYFTAYIITIALFIFLVYQLSNMQLQLGPFFSVTFSGGNSNIGSLFVGIKNFFYVIIALFAIYISRFFIKRRLKEVALLKTFGLSTKGIWVMFLIENIVVIVLGTLLGLIIGVAFSRFFILLVSSMIGIKLDQIDFIFSMSGLIDVFFLAIGFYIIISIIPLLSITKANINDLFKSSVANDADIKSPILSLILFVIFTLILIYLATVGLKKSYNSGMMFIYLVVACLVAVFFYRGLLVFIFNNKHNKKNRLNSIVRLLSFQHLATNIKRLYKMMSLITIFSGIFVASIIFTFGFINKVTSNPTFDKASHFVYVSKNEGIATKINHQLESKIGPTAQTKVYVTKDFLMYKKSDFKKIAYLNKNQIKQINEHKAIIFNFNDYDDQNTKIIEQFMKKHSLTKQNTIVDQEIFSNTNSLYLGAPEKGFQEEIAYNNIVVLNDNNPAFDNVKSYPVTYTKAVFHKADILSVFKIISDDALNNPNISIISTSLVSNAMNAIVFSLMQLIVLLVVIIVTVSLLMAVFFKNLENTEKGLEEYKIAKTLGMSDQQVFKANLIETLFTQALPFVIGFVCAIPLFNQLLFVDIPGNVFEYLFEPSVIGIIVLVFVILVVLSASLMGTMVKKINQR